MDRIGIASQEKRTFVGWTFITLNRQKDLSQEQEKYHIDKDLYIWYKSTSWQRER